jgi:hypothetical protein
MAFRMLTKYKFFRLFLTVDTFTSVFKENKLLRNHKTVEIMEFLNYFLLVDGRSGSVQKITDPIPPINQQKLPGFDSRQPVKRNICRRGPLCTLPREKNVSRYELL